MWIMVQPAADHEGAGVIETQINAQDVMGTEHLIEWLLHPVVIDVKPIDEVIIILHPAAFPFPDVRQGSAR